MSISRRQFVGAAPAVLGGAALLSACAPESDPIRFMAYAMTYARHEDMREIRRYVSDDNIREALDHAPAEIIDPRSWAYWNVTMGRYPAPPPPVRVFVASSGSKDRRLPHQQPVVRPKLEENVDLEDQRRAAIRAWQQMRAQEPTKHDLEEVRRQARNMSMGLRHIC